MILPPLPPAMVKKNEKAHTGTLSFCNNPDADFGENIQSLDTLQLLNAGNNDAFNEFYRYTSKDIYAFILKWINNKKTACKLLRETYVQFMASQANFYSPEDAKSALWNTAKERVFAYLREDKNKLRLIRAELSKNILHLSEDLSDELIERVSAAIEKNIRRLPALQQKAFTMNIYNGIDYRHIARKLGVKKKIIQVNLQFAFKKVHTWVMKDVEEEGFIVQQEEHERKGS